MRTINIIPQEFKEYGIVNKLSYEILPFDEINFPFKYILYYNDLEIVNSIDYLSELEFNDWSIFQLMDNKIENKIGLFIMQNNQFSKVYNTEESNKVDEENSVDKNVDYKSNFDLIKYLINIIKKLKTKIKSFIRI